MANQTAMTEIEPTESGAAAPLAQPDAKTPPRAGKEPVADLRPAANDGAAPAIVKIDPELNAPELFLNRELTWLAFNRRVFELALDERNPLLERVKFLAITASNLDEFFMKRIGGLKQQVVAGMHELTVDGRTPHQQIAECLVQAREFDAQQRALLPVLLAKLREYGIDVLVVGAADARRAGRDPRILLPQYLPAGDAARDGPGASFSFRIEPVAESAGHAARSGRDRYLDGAGQDSGRRREFRGSCGWTAPRASCCSKT